VNKLSDFSDKAQDSSRSQGNTKNIVILINEPGPKQTSKREERAHRPLQYFSELSENNFEDKM
jgi:hypothetical protein